MQNYRTESLFHYTKRSFDLISILTTRTLYPNFCEEDLSTEIYKDFILGIPQVCFCDIPLSRANTLRNNYGQYAIAFDKNWGIRHLCNPIQYIRNEEILNGVIHVFKRIESLKDELSTKKSSRSLINIGEEFKNILESFEDQKARMYILGFIKKYEGEWKGKTYCNYNENEWRYIVEDGFHNIFWKNGEEYKNWRGINTKTVKGTKKTPPKPKPSSDLKCLGLKFEIDDLHYIILKYDNQIPNFIDKLNKKNPEMGQEQLNLLISKITSFERIERDF